MVTRSTKPQKSKSALLVRPAPRKQSRALLQLGHITIPVSIGRNGRTAIKREGDGKTPIATLPILSGFYRGDKGSMAKTSLTMHRIQRNMLWCDAPSSPSYNRLVKAPFKSSHEEMLRQDGLYDVCLVLDWNVTSRRRNAGSAIFMHMIRPGYEPTAGCIALHPRDMRRVLPYLCKGRKIRVL